MGAVMTRKRVQTPAIRKQRALGAMETALNRIETSHYAEASNALMRAAAILREPVKEPRLCNSKDGDAMCSACDCWKRTRAMCS